MRGAVARARELSRELLGSPFLPLIAYSKVFESAVQAWEHFPAWVAAAVVATGAYVYADELKRRAEEAVEEVAEQETEIHND